MVRRVCQVSVSLELLMCGGGVFVFMAVVVTMWGSVETFVV